LSERRRDDGELELKEIARPAKLDQFFAQRCGIRGTFSQSHVMNG
jgi:hypothetical protein